MDSIQIIFFIASCLTLGALFSKDMLILRSIYLVSSILFLTSSIMSKIPIMIFFNIGYVVVNIYQIIRIYIERSDILLPADLKNVYHQVFSTMRPKEFLDFFNLGQKDQVAQGEFLCKQGDKHRYLIFMIAGEVAIKSHSHIVAILDGLFFIGEMRYLTQHPMSADVVAQTNVTFIKWDYEVLEALKIKKQETYNKFLEVMGRDLAMKIRHQQVILK